MQVMGGGYDGAVAGGDKRARDQGNVFSARSHFDASDATIEILLSSCQKIFCFSDRHRLY